MNTGLGYLGNGLGAVMPVEAMVFFLSSFVSGHVHGGADVTCYCDYRTCQEKGSCSLTGKLCEVIRESAQIGLSWVKAHAYELGDYADA